MKKSFTKKVILNSIQDLLINIDRFRVSTRQTSSHNSLCSLVSFVKHGMTKGFTLSEVLITLGVIGVVAAMTIPTLISKYQKHVYYTQFRKAASQIEQAFKLYEIDNGCEGNILNCKDNFLAEDIMPYFHVAQKINDDNFESVCKNKFTKEDYICYNDFGTNGYYAFITNDGILINLSSDAGSANGSYIDINGPHKGPNEGGRDIFIFYRPGVYLNEETKIEDRKPYVVWGGNESAIGGIDDCNDVYGCAAKLLQEGKMNY